jgi:hypothetical protein
VKNACITAFEKCAQLQTGQNIFGMTTALILIQSGAADPGETTG